MWWAEPALIHFFMNSAEDVFQDSILCEFFLKSSQEGGYQKNTLTHPYSDGLLILSCWVDILPNKIIKGDPNSLKYMSLFYFCQTKDFGQTSQENESSQMSGFLLSWNLYT